jgi:hypothetical protein
LNTGRAGLRKSWGQRQQLAQGVDRRFGEALMEYRYFFATEVILHSGRIE